MIPSFPIQLPDSARMVSFADIEVECSMLRLDRPCGNLTKTAFIIPTHKGERVIGYCQMCMDEQPSEWLRMIDEWTQRQVMP